MATQCAQALACYAQALRVAPEGHTDRALFHCNRAACYLRDNLSAEAIHECNEALTVKPSFGKALLWRAKAFEYKGDVNRALADCREMAAVRATPPPGGVGALATHRCARAGRRWWRAAAMEPSAPAAHPPPARKGRGGC